MGLRSVPREWPQMQVYHPVPWTLTLPAFYVCGFSALFVPHSFSSRPDSISGKFNEVNYLNFDGPSSTSLEWQNSMREHLWVFSFAGGNGAGDGEEADALRSGGGSFSDLEGWISGWWPQATRDAPLELERLEIWNLKAWASTDQQRFSLNDHLSTRPHPPLATISGCRDLFLRSLCLFPRCNSWGASR